MKEVNEGEQRLADALKPFGWTCGEDFWQRYHTDPWVFNLANAVERLTEDRNRLLAREHDRLLESKFGRSGYDPPQQTQEEYQC